MAAMKSAFALAVLLSPVAAQRIDTCFAPFHLCNTPFEITEVHGNPQPGGSVEVRAGLGASATQWAYAVLDLSPPFNPWPVPGAQNQLAYVGPAVEHIEPMFPCHFGPFGAYLHCATVNIPQNLTVPTPFPVYVQVVYYHCALGCHVLMAPTARQFYIQ